MSLRHRAAAVPPPEAFNLGTPATLNQDDAGQRYTLGVAFTVSKANGLWSAIDWYPPSQLPGTVSYTVAAFDSTGGVLLSSAPITPVAGGGKQRFQIPTVTPVVGRTYLAAMLTDHYTFSLQGAIPLPADTAHIDIPTGNGWFNAGATLTLPAGGPTGNFYFITPVIRF